MSAQYTPYIREDALLRIMSQGVLYGKYSRAQEQYPGCLVLSGKTAVSIETRKIVSENINEQFEFLLEDIRLVLQCLELKPSSLTSMRIYTLNPSGDMKDFQSLTTPSNECYNGYVQKYNLQISRTNIGIATLPSPDDEVRSLVEIEATAYIPPQKREEILSQLRTHT